MLQEPPRGFDGDTPVIFVEDTRVSDRDELLKRLPDLAGSGAELALARTVNHLTHGALFAVIDDPAGFAEAYRQRRDAEPEGQAPPDFGGNLALYELPDLDRISAPRLDGRRLVFFAENRALGVPYEVTFDLDAPSTTPSYTVL